MKKVSKLLVIFAAAVAMVLMMGCQQPSGGSGSSGGNKPSSNPSGGNPTPPVLNSEADLYVLGAYESSEGKLEFKDNKEGSFTPPASPNMRAAAISNFTWTAEERGSGTIIITIKYGVKTGTLERTNGVISGKLDNSTSEEISNMPLVSPQESDIRGKTGTLYYPSQSEMDKKLGTRILFYPTEISYASTGNNTKLTARHYDEDGSGRIVTKEYNGKWQLWTSSSSSEAYILLYDWRGYTADGLLKFNSDKSKAYSYNSNTGMLVYNVR